MDAVRCAKCTQYVRGSKNGLSCDWVPRCIICSPIEFKLMGEVPAQNNQFTIDEAATPETFKVAQEDIQEGKTTQVDIDWLRLHALKVRNRQLKENLYSICINVAEITYMWIMCFIVAYFVYWIF